MDGVTGSTQEIIKSRYGHTVHELMLYTNGTALVILTPIVVYFDQLNPGIAFCMENRQIAM